MSEQKDREEDEKVMFKETMTSPELREYIKAEELRGGLSLDFFYVELYRRTAYPVGTLILTIINADNNTLIWEGSATGTIEPSLSTETKEKRTQEVVAKLLANFPPT